MKKLPRALKLGLITGSSATLIGLVSISAVACFNSPASEPLNNETTKYRQVANIQAEGFFSEHTGNYLRSLSYDFFLTNLINTYPSLNLNAATAHITQITYNYALENSMGQLEVWIKSPYNAQNNGIYFNIQDIKTQLPLPLPPPPTQTLYNLSLNQLFPNTVLDAQSLAKLTKAN